MRLEALNEFVVFAKHLNFSTAAKELYLSQPGLSVHIANLEKELGLTLVDREGVLRLTPAGLLFLDCAQDMLDRYARGLEECESVSQAPPLVRVLSAHDNPEMMTIVSRIKTIPFTFISNDPEVPVLRALTRNLLDVGYCVDYVNDPVLRDEAEEHNITSFRFGEVLGTISMMKAHPCAKKTQLSREDFHDASIVIHSGIYYDSWRALIQNAIGDDVPLRFRLDPIGSMSNLAFTDFGESIHICGSQANDAYIAHRDDVVMYDQLDGKPLTFDAVIAYRADNPNPNVHGFVEELRRHTMDRIA